MTNEELVMEIKAGKTELMSALWSQVYKFVNQQAGRFYNTYSARCQAFGFDLEDIQQEGFIAIYDAIDGYDPARNTVFLTYAGYCLKKAFFSMTKMNYTGWQNNTIRSGAFSLDAPVSADSEEFSLADTIVADDNTEDTVVEKLYAESLRNDLTQAVGQLRESWRDLLYSVYVLDLRPAVIARNIGCARATVARKHRTALASLAKNPVLQAYRV